MNCNNSATIGTCHGSTPRKLFGTIGTKPFRTTSYGVLVLGTPKKMLFSNPNSDLSCAKVLEEGRRRGLGTPWTKQKLDLW
jgi:hypothetical protein